MASYDRYRLVRNDGTVGYLPSVVLTEKDSDYYEIYKQGNTRLDLLSNKYYNSPDYDWLILLANPEYGSMEFNIPNNVELRIPYPLDATIKEYEEKIKIFFEYYR